MIKRVLAGVRAYGTAKRIPRPAPPPVAAQKGRARVIDYGGSGPRVLFVPSLINPPHILDLAEGNSLLRWLAGQGVHPLLLDWGDPRACDLGFGRGLSVGGHVEHLLVPLLDMLGPDVALAGYCLGGTMALAAAALRPVAGVALIATPWDFDGYPEGGHSALEALWEVNRPFAEALGLFPMEMLQTAFWQLDPARTFEKFARFADLVPGSDEAVAFVALEDWANEGPPLTLAAAEELLVDFFRDNRPGDGNWHVGGQAIDPAALQCPLLNIVSSHDLIVPSATALSYGKQVTLEQGHVGMVVGRRAEKGLWRELGSWLSQLRHS